MQVEALALPGECVKVILEKRVAKTVAAANYSVSVSGGVSLFFRINQNAVPDREVEGVWYNTPSSSLIKYAKVSIDPTKSILTFAGSLAVMMKLRASNHCLLPIWSATSVAANGQLLAGCSINIVHKNLKVDTHDKELTGQKVFLRKLGALHCLQDGGFANHLAVDGKGILFRGRLSIQQIVTSYLAHQEVWPYRDCEEVRHFGLL